MNLQHFLVLESQMPTYSNPSASLGPKLSKMQRIFTTAINTEHFILLPSHSLKRTKSQRTGEKGRRKRNKKKKTPRNEKSQNKLQVGVPQSRQGGLYPLHKSNCHHYDKNSSAEDQRHYFTPPRRRELKVSPSFRAQRPPKPPPPPGLRADAPGPPARPPLSPPGAGRPARGRPRRCGALSKALALHLPPGLPPLGTGGKRSPCPAETPQERGRPEGPPAAPGAGAAAGRRPGDSLPTAPGPAALCSGSRPRSGRRGHILPPKSPPGGAAGPPPRRGGEAGGARSRTFVVVAAGRTRRARGEAGPGASAAPRRPRSPPVLSHPAAGLRPLPAPRRQWRGRAVPRPSPGPARPPHRDVAVDGERRRRLRAGARRRRQEHELAVQLVQLPGDDAEALVVLVEDGLEELQLGLEP